MTNSPDFSPDFEFTEEQLREAARIEEEAGCDIQAGIPPTFTAPAPAPDLDSIPGFEVPPIGSKWFNNRRKKTYTVLGVVSHCEDRADEWEVLYRSDDMPEGQYRRRSVESWYGTNRDNQPRFVQM